MAVSTYNSTTGVRTVVAGSENGSALDTRLTAVEEKIPSTASSTNKLVDEDSLGTASTKDATDVVRTGNHNLVESNAVANAINQALSSIYVPRGSLTCAELTSSLLIEANVGNVYEMSDSGTTSALFIQGAGQTISVGDNVGIIKAGESTYMYNYMGNAFDLTDYQKKDLTNPLTIGGTQQTTVEGALGGLNELVPSSASASNKLVSVNSKIRGLNTGNWISTNFNDAVPSDNSSMQIFTVLNSATNTPAIGANYLVITQAFDVNNIQQEAIQNVTNNRYIRYYDGSSWSSWEKLVTESEFKSYGIKTIWTGNKTKGDTNMNFDASPYDLCFARVGGTWCRLTTGVGGGSTTRKKFTSLYAGRDTTTGTPYEQYYLFDILGDGTVATCGWFNVGSLNVQNARLAGQKALELALAGTTTWTDPTWKYLSSVETDVNVSQIIGIKFQTKA